jgi:hypothetical protein
MKLPRNKVIPTYCKSFNPGEGGINTFRIEVGKEDGSVPSPLEVVAFLVAVGMDIAKESGYRDPQGLFHEIVDKPLDLTKQQMG